MAIDGVGDCQTSERMMARNLFLLPHSLPHLWPDDALSAHFIALLGCGLSHILADQLRTLFSHHDGRRVGVARNDIRHG